MPFSLENWVVVLARRPPVAYATVVLLNRRERKDAVNNIVKFTRMNTVHTYGTRMKIKVFMA
jgi:hypothetical protein